MTVTINGTTGIDKVQDGSIQAADLASGVPSRSQLPAGTVLQVVQGTTATAISTTSTSYVNTNITASITPTSATSKILVSVTACYDLGTSSESFGVQLLRNGSVVYTPQGADYGGPLYGYCGIGTATELIGPIFFSYVDSPATASSVTYLMQARKRNGSSSVTIPTAQGGGTGTATIILMEIAA